MKKIYIALMVLGTMLFSSCVQEKNFKDIKVGENELAFVMQGVSTRSADAAPAIKGVTIPMGKIASNGFYLEETIEELNPGVATKGQPAYTVTLPDIYPGMGVYAAGKFGDEVFTMYDQYGEGWRYNHNYNGSPWPDEKTQKVDFYLRMPASGGGVTMNEDHVSFKLTTPENGLDQKDLLFSKVSMSHEEHDAALPAGYPAHMKHALTGIKFSNGHLNGTQTKTIITKVELIGLNGYGEGTIGTDGVVTWANVGAPSTAEKPFYLVFDNPTYDKNAGAANPDGTVTEWNEKLAGTTWVDASDTHNLNHANGELTFWFIPQEVPDNLILNIEFYVKTPDTPKGQLVPASIELGKLLNKKSQEANGKNLKWEAGQLRTYSLKPLDVDVEIKDEISETIKENLHIANTGNVDEYVRMLIMGNWYGWKPGTEASEMDPESPDYVAPSILVGYKYKDAASTPAGHDVNEMVDPWYRGGYKNAAGVYVDPYGHFDDTFLLGSLGDRDGEPGDWADASGGYYFTMPIGPGDGVNTGQSATTDLFKSYTVTNVPTIWIPVGNSRQEALGVHLVMEIVIQAIAVPTFIDEDGTTKNVWWLQAWYDATGIDKISPDDPDNAAFKARKDDYVITMAN